MKPTILLAACLGLAAAYPASEPPPHDGLFTVDLTDLADAVREAGDANPVGSLDKRGTCPNTQTCVGRRCIELNCYPSPGGRTTICATWKYGKC